MHIHIYVYIYIYMYIYIHICTYVFNPQWVVSCREGCLDTQMKATWTLCIPSAVVARYLHVTCVTWLVHVCDMAHSCVRTVSFVWHTLHSGGEVSLCVLHDSCMRTKRLVYSCDLTHSYTWSGSFLCSSFIHVKWLIPVFEAIHSCGIPSTAMARHLHVRCAVGLWRVTYMPHCHMC